MDGCDQIQSHMVVRVKQLYVGYGPFPVTVTTRIITFVVGNPYKPLFATVTGKGPHPSYMTCMLGAKPQTFQ